MRVGFSYKNIQKCVFWQSCISVVVLMAGQYTQWYKVSTHKRPFIKISWDLLVHWFRAVPVFFHSFLTLSFTFLGKLLLELLKIYCVFCVFISCYWYTDVASAFSNSSVCVFFHIGLTDFSVLLSLMSLCACNPLCNRPYLHSDDSLVFVRQLWLTVPHVNPRSSQ